MSNKEIPKENTMSYKEILKRAQWSTRSGSKSTMSNKEILKRTQ
jgi:hypothetical protein